MSAELRFTILGCGSSGGVPRLGGFWGACDPANRKNRRKRCSMLIERETENGITRVLVDTSPDMHQQLLDAGVGELNAVVYTHAHADHVHGIDDLRQIVFNMRQRLEVWADEVTQKDLYERFGYAFLQPNLSPYPPILNMNSITDGPVTISGDGGDVVLTPLRVNHGSIEALGFRVGDLAYMPDVVKIYDETWPALDNLDCWIVDALRLSPHPTHAHLEMTLGWIEQAKPRRAVLTNMHIDLDYQTVLDETPDNVEPAYDGLVIRYAL